MATVERTLESLANRLIDLDGIISEGTRKVQHLSEEETRKFIESKKNKATLSKTKSDVKKVQEWLIEDGEDRHLETIPLKELDVLLSRFLLSTKKTKGNIKQTLDFEPSTLRGILGSLKRHLTENGYAHDIFSDREFKLTRDTLKAKCIDLKEKGLGNKENRADPFTKDEIALLYERNLLGNANPESLTNSMFLNNTMHLGLRGRQKHMAMLWGDLEPKTTSDGTIYLEYTERATKTRKGITPDQRKFMPKIFEQRGDPHCPVQLFLLYKEKRPSNMMDPESRFYVSINPRFGKIPGQPWFINQSMGKNTLGNIVKKMSQKAGLQGRHVNQSGRKTCISTLLDAGCHPTEVAQLSGHKNLMSLNHYHTVNLAKQQEMSSIIHAQHHKQKSVTSIVASCSTSNTDDFSNTDDISDQDLLQTSQEIEQALSTIQQYENVEQVVDLPVVQSPGGTLNVRKIFEKPQALFQGCTFNNAVNIVFRK